MLAALEEALGDDDLVGAALGVALDLGAVLLAVEVLGLGLAGEHHRRVVEVGSGHAGDADAGRLDGQDLVDLLALKKAGPLGAHLVVKRDVALVVEEAVDLQDVALTNDAILANAVLELLHAEVLLSGLWCAILKKRLQSIMPRSQPLRGQNLPFAGRFPAFLG